MARPEQLPDFAAPPLNEVVLGVQFTPPPGYSQILAGQVWSLFKSEFPRVEEHPPLAPQFETFGRPTESTFNFGFVTGASHDRFWFLNDKRGELIQFQHDRLLHNWRKVGDGPEYPRYEMMIQAFERELRSLSSYFATLSPQELQISQCEISYVNHIPCDGDRCDGSRWLRFLQLDADQAEDFNLTFRRILSGPDGQPRGRLTCEAAVALVPTPRRAQRVIRFALTARGAPPKPNLDSALEMLGENREIVIESFTALTTESAHAEWQRVK